MTKKWIQGMKLNKGAFTAYCKRKGYGGVTEACIQKGLKSPNPSIRKEANLARTFRKINKKRRKT